MCQGRRGIDLKIRESFARRIDGRGSIGYFRIEMGPRQSSTRPGDRSAAFDTRRHRGCDYMGWFSFAALYGSVCYDSGRRTCLMATYKKIQAAVQAESGIVPKTCWIARVKSDLGLTTRQAPNRISQDWRQHPCPPEKRPAIISALRKLGML